MGLGVHRLALCCRLTVLHQKEGGRDHVGGWGRDVEKLTGARTGRQPVRGGQKGGRRLSGGTVRGCWGFGREGGVRRSVVVESWVLLLLTVPPLLTPTFPLSPYIEPLTFERLGSRIEKCCSRS